ncbi:hypothetical protein M409DRAFT_21420 [Zasmidium cellare ATCC 36951]|uniref:Uncharacterized protein n=1 Tax=Zasmidium cellare ATCC 36951 TaxID=1080233 RepID=A0A6A6CRC0_ZASCE|nr:uncharacterized protein M409DRAFT_21420 [Zasmidium cellare ATCC 36951]KAF2168680.1 hypothetical protein M409DRAFT_21420 [Zasmidium cellare ATCC 36951]
MDAPTASERESRSTTSSPNDRPPIAANNELWVVLSRAKSTSTKAKLKKLLTFGAKKPITFVKIEAILTSAHEVMEFMKSYAREHEEMERHEVEICYSDGKQALKWDDDTGGFDEVATGVRFVDRKEKVVRDVWAQMVKFVDGVRVEML